MKKPAKIEQLNANLKSSKPERLAAIRPRNGARLSEHVAAVNKYLHVGQSCVFEIGKSLDLVREEKDFPDDTFEAFVKREWGWERQRAYELIDAYKVTSDLPPNVINLLQNPGQVKALKAAPKSERAAVVTEVASTGKVTAGKITKAIEQKKEKPVDAEFSEVDHTGYPIPQKIYAEWQRAQLEGKAILAVLVSARKTMEEKIAHDPAWVELSNSENTRIRNLTSDVRRILPHAVCPSCDASGKSCKHCKGRGYISKYLWDVCPKEAKKGRT